MYNIEQLKMFVKCAELGSFSACAKSIGKVQSAVSQGISNLEIDLGIQLFDRSTRKPTLTIDGKHLLAFAEATLQQMHEFESASNALSNKEESKLSLAIDSNLKVDRYYQIMQQFSDKFPATSLDSFSANSSDIIQLIAENKIDIGLVCGEIPFTNTIELCYIGNIQLVAVVSPEHALTSHETVTASHLISHRQLMVKGLYNKPQQTLKLSPQIWWANDSRVLQQYAKKGIGWCYLPKHMVENDIARGELKMLPLSFDHKPWSTPVERITPKNKVMGPANTWLTQKLTTLLD